MKRMEGDTLHSVLLWLCVLFTALLQVLTAQLSPCKECHVLLSVTDSHKEGG